MLFAVTAITLSVDFFKSKSIKKIENANSEFAKFNEKDIYSIEIYDKNNNIIISKLVNNDCLESRFISIV